MPNNFGVNLKTLRIERKLSRERLARHLRIKSGQSIQDYENGTNTTLDILIRIADFFDVSIDKLLKEKI